MHKTLTPEQAESTFFSGKRLKEPVIKWLRDEMGFSERIIRATRFRRADKLGYYARTFYKTVWFQNPHIPSNATHYYSMGEWLNLLAHEMQHRQDMGNNMLGAVIFGLKYSFYWIRNYFQKKHPYFDNPYEQKAFSVGCTVDSKVNKWLREHPDINENGLK